MHPRPQRPTGYTLIELMITVAIIGILAMLATTAMMYGTGRARMNNAAFEVTSLLSVGQIRATAIGVPHFAVFVQEPAPAPRTGDRIAVFLLERDDSLGALDWTTANLANDLAAVGGQVRDRVLLVSSDDAAGTNEVDLAPLGSPQIPLTTLPQPFAAIPLTPGAAGTRLGAACSFCIVGGGSTRGVIRFNPDGTVRLLTGNSLAGGVLALRPHTAEQRPLNSRLIVISVPAGVYRVF